MVLRVLTLRRDAYQLWNKVDGRRREIDASRRGAALALAVNQGIVGTVFLAQ